MKPKVNNKINILLKDFQKLSNLIDDAVESQELSDPDFAAVKRDRSFVEFAIIALSTVDTENINNLWSQVQNVSRFFGGDYLRYYKPNEFEALLDKIFDRTFDVVIDIRKLK